MNKYVNIFCGLIILLVIIVNVATMIDVTETGEIRIGACRSADNIPEVNLVWNVAEPVMDETKSLHQIQAMTNQYRTAGKIRDAGGIHYKTAAFVEAKHQTQYKVNAQFTKTFKGTCLNLKSVDVSHVLNQTLYLNSKDYKSKCEFNILMDHEMKHLYINKEEFEKSVPLLQKNFEDSVAAFAGKYGFGPYSNDELSIMSAKLDEYLAAAILLTNHEWVTVRDRRQAKVDTVSEYRRMGTLARRTCR